MWVYQGVPSGKHKQKTMDRSAIFHRKIHYFDWATFNSYVKLTEGIVILKDTDVNGFISMVHMGIPDWMQYPTEYNTQLKDTMYI